MASSAPSRATPTVWSNTDSGILTHGLGKAVPGSGFGAPLPPHRDHISAGATVALGCRAIKLTAMGSCPGPQGAMRTYLLRILPLFALEKFSSCRDSWVRKATAR